MGASSARTAQAISHTGDGCFAAPAPQPLPQGEGSSVALAAQPVPQNYQELVALFELNKEGPLHAQLYSNVRPVRCQAGHA